MDIEISRRAYQNEIDHFLSNDSRVVINFKVLNNFQFSSNHRVGIAIIKIPSRIKYKNYRNNTTQNTNKWKIPKHKETAATEVLDQKLLSEELSRMEEM